MSTINFSSGKTPVILSIPHSGTELPIKLLERLTTEGSQLPDTDWYLPELLVDAKQKGISVIEAKYSRYLIDLNRPLDDIPLYKGATTNLAPIATFHGQPIYKDKQEPGESEIEIRKNRYWLPYHTALQSEIKRCLEHYGTVILFDAHSICPVVPRLFDGVLPDLNIGTNEGNSAEPGLVDGFIQTCKKYDEYSLVRDCRFKGGYITRNYGDPSKGVHSIQLEISQSTYLDTKTLSRIEKSKADRLQRLLNDLMDYLISFSTARV